MSHNLGWFSPRNNRGQWFHGLNKSSAWFNRRDINEPPTPVTLTGTVTTSSVTELDVVSGGQTIVLTLTGDTFAQF